MKGLRILGIIGALTATTLTGCEDDQAPATTVRVGQIDGGLLIAVVVEDGAVVAYACDGTEAGVTVSAWFSGAATDDGFSLTHASKPFTLTGTFDGDALAGTLDLDGAAMAFTADLATGDAGLYEADDGDLRGGWIFTDAGDQRGAVLSRSTGDVAAALLTQPSQATLSFAGKTLRIARARPRG